MIFFPVICNEQIVLSETGSYQLTSPSYPGVYSNYLDCEWSFTTLDASNIIKLELSALSIESGCQDYLLILDTYDGNDTR